MRMRKKKHLEERLEVCAPVMLKMQNQNEHANDPLDDELFFDSMKVFGNNNPLHLEVGCGKGSFILELARRNPDINYVAVEKTPNVLVTGAEALMESSAWGRRSTWSICSVRTPWSGCTSTLAARSQRRPMRATA